MSFLDYLRKRFEKATTAGIRGKVNPRLARGGIPSPRTVPRAEVPDGRRTTRQHPTATEDIDNFLNGEQLTLLSSNVHRAQYDNDTQTLYIWYLDKGYGGHLVWAYSPYSPTEVADFIRAPSFGGWLADNVRDYSRGVHAHKRGARPVS